MPTIDGENAKQIREPMDVLIQMDARDSLALTYSGYSDSAKVTDGSLNRPEWSMRKIADLQGDGFPLNGTHVLYNSTTTASSRNGHIGVRGHIGQPVVITVTATTTISTVSIVVSGATTVSAGGNSYNAAGGSLIIPVENTTVTLTFAPAQADGRIEVAGIVAGTYLRIGNEALIRCVVSLRSDLSIINPTLPESEINIECFNDADVSEYVAQIPEDTPITYSAGYPGDMSATRRFYVSGQVEWADNVLNIHGVDAVHLLDVGLYTFGSDLDGLDETLPDEMYYTFSVILRALIPEVRVDYLPGYFTGVDGINTHQLIAPRGTSLREYLAEFVNICRYRGLSADYFQPGQFVFDYIDAGQPRLTCNLLPTTRRINKADCADVVTAFETKISELTVNSVNTTCMFGWNNPGGGYRDYRVDYTKVGTGTWIKNKGVFLNLDNFVKAFYVGVVHNGKMRQLVPSYPRVLLEDGTDSPDWWYLNDTIRFSDLDVGGLMDAETVQGEARIYDSTGEEVPMYTQVIPWNIEYGDPFDFNSMASAWNWMVSNGYIQSEATQADVDLYGGIISTEAEKTTYINAEGTPGISEEISFSFFGKMIISNSDETKQMELFPRKSVQELMKRSNKTGSFTWKGDPRMQPRDVVEFVNLDGSTTVITLENITLTHEGGGLSAEITYREGIV